MQKIVNIGIGIIIVCVVGVGIYAFRVKNNKNGEEITTEQITTEQTGLMIEHTEEEDIPPVNPTENSVVTNEENTPDDEPNINESHDVNMTEIYEKTKDDIFNNQVTHSQPQTIEPENIEVK